MNAIQRWILRRLGIVDNLRFRTNCTIEERDASTGALLSRQVVHNLLPSIGLTSILHLIAGDGQLPMTYLAVGTDPTTPQMTDVGLGSEAIRQPVTQMIVIGPNLTIKHYLDPNSANGYTICECGGFDLGGGGNMFGRITFTPIVKTSANTITITWTVIASG